MVEMFETVIPSPWVQLTYETVNFFTFLTVSGTAVAVRGPPEFSLSVSASRGTYRSSWLQRSH